MDVVGGGGGVSVGLALLRANCVILPISVAIQQTIWAQQEWPKKEDVPKLV